MFKIFCLILLVSIQFVAGLKLSKICYIRDHVCKGTFNSANKYVVKCEKAECNESNPHTCGPDYCSSDAETCKSYQRMRIVVKNLMKSSKTYEKQISKYTSFIKSIQNCSSTSYKLQMEDVCINGQNCYVKKPLKLRYSGLHLYNKIDCPCSNINGFQCGDKYCAVNQYVCNEFHVNMGQNSSLIAAIKKCGNDNTIIEVKKSFFA